MPADVTQFVKNLQARRKAVEGAALLSVDIFGEHVIGDAEQLTPVLTGTLAASGTTEPATIRGNQISKTMGFNTIYAAAVHENLTARHAVGQAKYLEAAMRRNGPKFNPFMANRLKPILEAEQPGGETPPAAEH
jgi:hypothetical protein